MKEFVIAKNSKNKEKIESALSGIRKTVVPYIYDKLHMIGNFSEDITVDSISCQSFSESLYTEDKDGNKFFFAMDTLYGETKMETDFSSSNYSCVIAKKIEDDHYSLYNVLDNDIIPFGTIYVKSNSMLCVFEDFRKAEVIYRSRENSNLEYKVTVENDECLEEYEFRDLAILNDDKKPVTLLEYLHNYMLFRDINRCSCIDILSNNKNGVVGEIRIRYGLLDEYNICESVEDYRLDMSVKNSDVVVNSTNYQSKKVDIEELPQSLRNTYQEGIQIIKKYGKKKC